MKKVKQCEAGLVTRCTAKATVKCECCGLWLCEKHLEEDKKDKRAIVWVQATKRTNDPKLAYLEQRLTDMGIMHRRRGESFHAPIMEIDASKEDTFWALMNERRGRYVLDEVRDDHPSFSEFTSHDLLTSLDGHGLMENYMAKRGLRKERR